MGGRSGRDGRFFIFICLLIGKNDYLCMRNTDRLRFRMIKKAQVAELVDALVSGASGFAIVQVRVLFWAPFLAQVVELVDTLL